MISMGFVALWNWIGDVEAVIVCCDCDVTSCFVAIVVIVVVVVVVVRFVVVEETSESSDDDDLTDPSERDRKNDLESVTDQ